MISHTAKVGLGFGSLRDVVLGGGSGMLRVGGGGAGSLT